MIDIDAPNCVVINEMGIPGMPGATYLPGRELCLGAVLLEDWQRRGFVRLIGERAAAEKPAPEKKKRKRAIKTNKAVTV